MLRYRLQASLDFVGDGTLGRGSLHALWQSAGQAGDRRRSWWAPAPRQGLAHARERGHSDADKAQTNC